MADSILKLKVESSEYDQKLANAAKGIRHLADVAHTSAGDLTGLEKSELDYIRALGEMETKSRTASGQVRELSNTYKELKVIYDQLNEVEKADEGGKALAASLETLKQRAQEAKSQLDSATQSLNDNGDAGKSTSGIMEMLKDRFTVNIDAIKLFNMGLQAAEGVLNVVKDAFFSNEENLDDWGRTVETSRSLYDGFLYALNTGDIGGFLNNIDQIVQAAQNAYDALDELQTFNAFNQINVQRTRTDMTESIADYRSGNGSKDTVRAAGEAYKKELQERKRMEKDAYLAAVERVAAERGVSAKDLTDALSGTYGHYQDLKKVNPTGERTVYYGGGMFGGGGSYIEKYAQNPQERLGQALRHLTDTELESLQALGAQAERTGDEIAQVDKQLTRVLNGKQPGGGTTTRTGTKKEEILPEGSVAALTKQMQQLQKEQQLVTSYAGWQEYQQQIEAVSDRISLLKGELPKDKEAVFTVTAETSEAIDKVRDIEGVTIDPKALTVTAQTQEAIAALQRVDGLTIQPKTAEVTFRADNSDVLDKVSDIEGVTIDPKTLTVTAQTQEAIAALQRVDGLTIQPKTAEVTFRADDSDVLAKVSDIEGVTIDPKTLTVTAETSEALRSVQELIGDLEGTTVQLKVKAEPQAMAIGTSIQNSAGLSEYISDLQKQLSTANFATPLYNNLQAQLADTTTLQNLVGEALKVGLGTALFDVADETGADFWTRTMEGGVKNIDWQAIIDQINEARKAAGLDAISLDFATGSVTEEKKGKDSLQDSKTVLNAISQLTSGLESIGVEIPSEIQSVISVMQGVIQVIEAVNAIIGVTQTTALTANTIAMTSLTTALWANTATSWIPGLAGGGIVPHFAGGGLIGKAALGMTIPGHSYSGDLLRLPVDGGRGMIGVNSGEVIMNQAQAGILESELSGGRMRDINVHGVLQGENIVLAVSNYFRRTGKGEAAMWGKN